MKKIILLLALLLALIACNNLEPDLTEDLDEGEFTAEIQAPVLEDASAKQRVIVYRCSASATIHRNKTAMAASAKGKCSPAADSMAVTIELVNMTNQAKTSGSIYKEFSSVLGVRTNSSLPRVKTNVYCTFTTLIAFWNIGTPKAQQVSLLRKPGKCSIG
jgi:hypothetical protein